MQGWPQPHSGRHHWQRVQCSWLSVHAVEPTLKGFWLSVIPGMIFCSLDVLEYRMDGHGSDAYISFSQWQKLPLSIWFGQVDTF